MKNFIKHFALPLALVAVLVPAVALAATTFNNDSRDYATLRVNNDTRNPNNPNTWASSITADPGDQISFAIYYHNTGNETARNVRVTLTPQTSGSKTTHTFTATVRADNASTVTGSATVTLSSPSAISVESGHVTWRPNQTTFGSQAFPNGQSGMQIFNGGVNLGDIAPGWSTQGSIVVGYSIDEAQVPTQNPPTVNISANPTTINEGNSSTLSWNSTNADTCYASGGWSGTQNVSGSRSVSPSNTTTYTITCSNEAGSRSDSVTVYVNQVQQDLPTLDFYASPTSINRGDASTLHWNSSNADTCYASGGWSGSQNLDGSRTVYPAQTTTYTLRCSNDRGDVVRSVTVYVTEVQYNTIDVSLSVSPSTINQGQTATLYWSSNNANYCYASGGWSGNKNLSGSEQVSPNYTTTYTIRCTNNYDTESRSVTLYVNNNNYYQTPTVNIYASPKNIYSGQSSVLYWNTTNANYCYASGGWSGSKSTSGSEVVYPNQTTTYTLACSNNNATQSGSDTVFVNQQQTNNLSISCVASPVDPRTGDEVTFAAGAAGGSRPYYYSWSGDVNSSEQIFTRTFSTTGTRVTQLTVTDAAGNRATASCSVSVRARSVYVPPVKPPYKPPVVVTPVCKYVEACSVDGGKTYTINRDLSSAECNPLGNTVSDNSNNQPSNPTSGNGNNSMLASLFVTQAGGLSLIGILALFLFFLLVILGIFFVALQVRNRD